MSQKYNDYLKTDYWKAVSEAVKKRAGYRCQLCNSQHDLAAHHRSYDHRGHELNFLEDLTCLCRRCHSIFHGIVPSPVQPELPAAMVMHQTKRQRRHQREKVRAGLTNIRPHTESDIDAEMPEGTTILLTRELIARCRTNGAFTTSTIEALGVSAHFTQGWVDRLCGKAIPREQFRAALAGKYVYAKACFPKGA